MTSAEGPTSLSLRLAIAGTEQRYSDLFRPLLEF